MRFTRYVRPIGAAAVAVLAVTGAAAGAVADVGQDDTVVGIVVKVDTASEQTIADIVEEHPVSVDRALLGSRGIYLLHGTDPATAGDAKETGKLAKEIAHSDGVDYAEPDIRTDLADTRYHNWDAGDPVDAGTSTLAWLDQDLSRTLGLPAAHEESTGAGVVVAVLDTGVDADHPALVGRLLPGYDYVDDDPQPDETRTGVDANANGVVDEAYGHGTFVAGTVALVAPGAKIVPMRVLNSDGAGTVFLVAEAINDAVAMGVDVINMSLGTSEKIDSDLVKDVLQEARKAGVVVVAAAGNNGDDERQHPADDKNVLSVTSASNDSSGLAPYASRGDWVGLAAPSERVMGPTADGGFVWWSGSSMAAPMVSGLIALIAAEAGEQDVKHRLEAVTKSARKVDGVKLKHGVIDVSAALDRALADH